MSEQISVSKDAAVELLQKAGYESYLEDGVVFVKWNDDPNLPDTIAEFLRSHGYMASYGIKGRAKGVSSVSAVSDTTEVVDDIDKSSSSTKSSDGSFEELFTLS